MNDKLKRLEDKKNYYKKHKGIIPKLTLEKYELDFAIRYTHESTKIEGNTLSLIENKLIIEDRMSIGGKSLREVYEVENHNKAFQYIKDNINKGIKLDNNVIKDIHEILMDNILQHKPPSRTEMYNRLNAFYYDLKNKNLNPIEKAAWVHAEFVVIHPFEDGNGRTSRMLMNYILMENGYLPVNIESENKISYYEALDEYGKSKNLDPFLELVVNLEEDQLDTYIDLIEQII